MNRADLASRFAAFLLAFLIAGCAGRPPIPYSDVVAPHVLRPLALSDVKDMRGRFRDVYCKVRERYGRSLPDDRMCDEALHRLPGEPASDGIELDLATLRTERTYVVVPGIFGECVKEFVTPFELARKRLQEAFGVRTALMSVSGRSSSEANAQQIRRSVVELWSDLARPMVLIGYSKGTSDILEAVVRHWGDLEGKVAAVVSVAGTVNGSVLPEALPNALTRFAEITPFAPCPVGDQGGLKSLRRTTRLNWLAQANLPEEVRYYSVVAFAERDRISSILRPLYDITAQVNPHNDSQVIYYDGIIPGAALLGFVNADHWAVALPFARKMPVLSALAGIDRNDFPREVLLEAIVRFIEDDFRRTVRR